ncbi:MAG TPA: phosphoribosylglycinamide formyltransferase [candidate division Zixibacteria bacterium]|nr:phosphoribosylglycinamide formyltransferase [candidate division Zixibacteria bacterium]
MQLAVFVSGGGSNLQAIIDAASSGKLDLDIALVLSNNANAYGLERARNSGIPTAVVNSKDFDSREEFIRAFLGTLEAHDVDFIALAGYLRKIPPELIQRFDGRIVNIHPGALPEFGGKGMFGIHVHEAVIESGRDNTAVTVHFVTEEYDEGAVIAVREVPVLPDDTPETLQARVLEVEHALYPEVLQSLAEKLRSQ